MVSDVHVPAAAIEKAIVQKQLIRSKNFILHMVPVLCFSWLAVLRLRRRLLRTIPPGAHWRACACSIRRSTRLKTTGCRGTLTSLTDRVRKARHVLPSLLSSLLFLLQHSPIPIRILAAIPSYSNIVLLLLLQYCTRCYSYYNTRLFLLQYSLLFLFQYCLAIPITTIAAILLQYCLAIPIPILAAIPITILTAIPITILAAITVRAQF